MKHIPIFLASDDNYAPFVATTIASICNNTKSFCDFYILDGGITEENRAKICELKKRFDNFSIEFLDVNLEKYFKDLPETQYISKAMYSRFLIPELKPEINKAIYSDVDVIVMGDIAEMYNEDLEGYALGAVWEEYAEGRINNERKAVLNLAKEHKYFSSGNLLFDCKKWREDQIFSSLMKIKINPLWKTPDMDILNIYFNNNYKILSPKYCWINQNYYFYRNSSNIVIRHFNGKIKPWHINPEIKTSLLPNKDDFWKYAQLSGFYDFLYAQTSDEFKQTTMLRHLRLMHLKYKNMEKRNG